MTLGDYIDRVRISLDDTQPPYRWGEPEIKNALTFSYMELVRVRPSAKYSSQGKIILDAEDDFYNLTTKPLSTIIRDNLTRYCEALTLCAAGRCLSRDSTDTVNVQKGDAMLMRGISIMGQ